MKIYDVERLKWNTVYNARAGAEILLRYLQQYGAAEEKQTGNLDNAAALKTIADSLADVQARLAGIEQLCDRLIA